MTKLVFTQFAGDVVPDLVLLKVFFLNGEHNFILKIDLSNKEIPKVGPYNKKKKCNRNLLYNFFLKNTKLSL